MKRRALPLAAAAVSLALVPATASATPTQAPVETYQFAYYYAVAEDIVLPDGRHVTATVSESAGANQRDAWGFLSLDVWTEYACGPEICSSHAFGFVQLTGEQIDVDRSLRAASIDEVSVEVTDPSYDPDPWTGEDPGWETPGEEDPGYEAPGAEDPGYETPGEEGPGYETPGEDTGGGEEYPGEEDPWEEYPTWEIPPPAAPVTMTVSLSFTGIGKLDNTATHWNICGDGERECESVRVDSSRSAIGHLTVDGVGADSTVGYLFHGRSVDAAAPKIVYGEN